MTTLWILYVAGFAISWLPIAWTLHRHDKYAGAALSSFLGGAASLIWPLALPCVLVFNAILWLEARANRVPLPPKPPAGGPFR